MDFLKKHYEKILLGVVLVGLVGGLVVLLLKIGADRDALKAKEESKVNPHVQALSNLDLTIAQDALKLVSTPAVIDLGPPNRLFNPMAWQKANDGRLIPQDKVGPVRLAVTNITPLYLKITFESTTVSDSGAKYQIGVEKQAQKKPKRSSFLKANEKDNTQTFTLVDVKGKPEDPSSLTVQLADTNERGTVTKDKPFLRVDGYMADLFYDLEKRPFPNKRVGDSLSFNGEDYKILTINQDEVILEAQNKKKWTIKYNPESRAANNAAP
jgi:hypothetical protein